MHNLISVYNVLAYLVVFDDILTWLTAPWWWCWWGINLIWCVWCFSWLILKVSFKKSLEMVVDHSFQEELLLTCLFAYRQSNYLKTLYFYQLCLNSSDAILLSKLAFSWDQSPKLLLIDRFFYYPTIKSVNMMKLSNTCWGLANRTPISFETVPNGFGDEKTNKLISRKKIEKKVWSSNMPFNKRTI